MIRTDSGVNLAWNPPVPFQIGTQPTLRQGRFWSLFVFYAGLALVYLPVLSTGHAAGKVLIGLGLGLALFPAPAALPTSPQYEPELCRTR